MHVMIISIMRTLGQAGQTLLQSNPGHKKLRFRNSTFNHLNLNHKSISPQIILTYLYSSKESIRAEYIFVLYNKFAFIKSNQMAYYFFKWRYSLE